MTSSFDAPEVKRVGASNREKGKSLCQAVAFMDAAIEVKDRQCDVDVMQRLEAANER